jgi:hypothetical protein
VEKKLFWKKPQRMNNTRVLMRIYSKVVTPNAFIERQ